MNCLNCGGRVTSDGCTCTSIAALKGQIATLKARVSELNGALRLHLAVSPDDPLIITPIEKEIVLLRAEIATLTSKNIKESAVVLRQQETIDSLMAQNQQWKKESRVLVIKNAGTLANNLCPDHRDKQTGKPCLACEIERLTALAYERQEIIKEQTQENAALEKTATEQDNCILHFQARVAALEEELECYKLNPDEKTKLISKWQKRSFEFEDENHSLREEITTLKAEVERLREAGECREFLIANLAGIGGRRWGKLE
ncbi:MAG: hypothetical protein ABIJ57_01005 [Pseudomonadota bacterium]